MYRAEDNVVIVIDYIQRVIPHRPHIFSFSSSYSSLDTFR